MVTLATCPRGKLSLAVKCFVTMARQRCELGLCGMMRVMSSGSGDSTQSGWQKTDPDPGIARAAGLRGQHCCHCKVLPPGGVSRHMEVSQFSSMEVAQRE